MCLFDLVFFSTEAAAERAGGSGGAASALPDCEGLLGLSVGWGNSVTGWSPGAGLVAAGAGFGGVASAIAVGVALPVETGDSSSVDFGETSSVGLGVSLSGTVARDGTARFKFWIYRLTACMRDLASRADAMTAPD